MKRTILVGALALLAGIACAAPQLVGPASFTTVPTNETAQPSGMWTNTTLLWGYLDYVSVDLTATYAPSPTCTVEVVTLGDAATGPAQTLLSVTAGDGLYQPFRVAQNNVGADTNWQTRFPLCGDRIKVSAYAVNGTTNAVALKVYIGITAQP